MQLFVDLFKRKILLSKESLGHILKRQEMLGQEDKIELTLLKPALVKRSTSDKKVVAKIGTEENFIITSYFTDRIKKGELIWKKN